MTEAVGFRRLAADDEYDTQGFILEYIIILWFFLAVAVAWFVWRYADPSQMEWHCTTRPSLVRAATRRATLTSLSVRIVGYATISVAFFCSIGIISLCPPDVAITLDGRAHPDGGAAKHYFEYSLAPAV